MNIPFSIRGRKFSDFSPIVVTLINGVGWLLVYFLVLSPQADQSRTQTMLLDAQLKKIQSINQKLLDQNELREISGRIQLDDANRRFVELQIGRLEGATSRLEEQLANLRVRAQTTNDLNSVLQAIRPNVLLGKFDFNFPYADQVEIEHEISNIGLNSVTLSVPVVRLSLKPISDSNNINNNDLLVPDRDYVLNVSGVGIWQPKFTAKSSYSIKLLNRKLIGSTIYFNFHWKASTDPLAVSIAGQILGEQIMSSQLKELSVFGYTLTGTFSFRKNQNIRSAWPLAPPGSDK